MENQSYQPLIVKLSHMTLLLVGVLFLALALLAEGYILSEPLTIISVTIGLFLIEGTLVTILYNAFISRKHKLKQWSKNNLTIGFIVTLSTFVWTCLLFELGKGVYHVLFS